LLAVAVTVTQQQPPVSETGLVVGLVGGSHFVNHMYFMLLPPVFVALRGEFGVGDAQLGLALGVLGVVVTALQLPFGHISDTYSRTAVLAISLVVGAAGAVLTATATSYAWLLAAQVVLGVGIAGHHPAHYPMLSAATDAGQRGRAYSVHGFTGSLGFGAPPAIVAAGELLGVGWRTSLGVIAAIGATYAVVCLAAVRRYVGPEVTRPPLARREELDTDAGQGHRTSDRIGAFLRAVRGVVSAPAMVLLTVLWFVSSMASWGIRQYTATLLGEYGLGVAVTLGLGAVLVFGAGWLADRLSVAPVLLVGYAALVVVAGLLAWAGLPVLAAVPLALLLSPAVDSSRPARAKLADLLSTDENVGKNFGLLTIGISGGGAVAPPVLGVVVESAGVRTAFVAIAGLGLLALGLTAVVLAASDDAGEATAEPTP